MDFLKKLEKTVTLNLEDGSQVDFSTDYRLFVEYSIILDIKDEDEQLDSLISFLQRNNLPLIESSVQVLSDLYFKTDVHNENALKKKKNNFNYNFSILWPLIEAGFISNYNIFLSDVDMDFRLFKRLLNELHNTLFNEVIRCWNADLSDKNISKKEKKHIAEIKERYPLGNTKVIDVSQRDKDMKEYVRNRHRELRERRNNG